MMNCLLLGICKRELGSFRIILERYVYERGIFGIMGEFLRQAGDPPCVGGLTDFVYKTIKDPIMYKSEYF